MALNTRGISRQIIYLPWAVGASAWPTAAGFDDVLGQAIVVGVS